MLSKEQFAILVEIIQYPANVSGLKKHILSDPHNDRSSQKDNDGFNAFGLRRHGYLLLHEIDEQMEYDARKNRTVACEINPGDDKAHWDGAYEEVDHKQRIDHESRLIGPFDEDKREMPERPYRTEDDRLPEPIHVVSDGVFTIPFPADFFQRRSDNDREKSACHTDPCKREILSKGKLIKRLSECKGKQNRAYHDQRKNTDG